MRDRNNHERQRHHPDRQVFCLARDRAMPPPRHHGRPVFRVVSDPRFQPPRRPRETPRRQDQEDRPRHHRQDVAEYPQPNEHQPRREIQRAGQRMSFRGWVGHGGPVRQKSGLQCDPSRALFQIAICSQEARANCGFCPNSRPFTLSRTFRTVLVARVKSILLSARADRPQSRRVKGKRCPNAH